MATNDPENTNTPEEEPDTVSTEQSLPIGIARIREEWSAAGLIEEEKPPVSDEVEPVVFSEVDGGAGIGDYVIDRDTVRDRLALSDGAVDRLISSGELDSILVQGPDEQPRRLISEASFNRFREDAAIDPEAVKRVAKTLADKSIAEAIQNLQGEIDSLKDNQSKVLQQMKDMLLLEVRNLKEQDRDLTSFLYELAAEIRRVLPKSRR